jgi:hypothetical protein
MAEELTGVSYLCTRRSPAGRRQSAATRPAVDAFAWQPQPAHRPARRPAVSRSGHASAYGRQCHDRPRNSVNAVRVVPHPVHRGSSPRAVVELEQLLPDSLRLLGPDHLDTLGILSNLAQSRRRRDPAGAVAGLAGLLPEQIRALGPDHPYTLDARLSLAHWRGEAGDMSDAILGLGELLPEMIRVLGPDHPQALATRRPCAPRTPIVRPAVESGPGHHGRGRPRR